MFRGRGGLFRPANSRQRGEQLMYPRFDNHIVYSPCSRGSLQKASRLWYPACQRVHMHPGSPPETDRQQPAWSPFRIPPRRPFFFPARYLNVNDLGRDSCLLTSVWRVTGTGQSILVCRSTVIDK